MFDLEVAKVGETLSRKFLNEVSANVNLPTEVCAVLLKSGWTLEVAEGKPAMWVQAWPNELRN